LEGSRIFRLFRQKKFESYFKIFCVLNKSKNAVKSKKDSFWFFWSFGNKLKKWYIVFNPNQFLGFYFWLFQNFQILFICLQAIN